jgi:hypothetical protein
MSTNKKKSRVYILARKRYFFPQPYENDIFPLLVTRHFFTPIVVFFLNSSLFCIYFNLLSPLFSFSFPFLPFSIPFLPLSILFLPYSIPFLPFLSRFVLFLLHFPLYPKMTSADILSPLLRGGGGFSNV